MAHEANNTGERAEKTEGWAISHTYICAHTHIRTYTSACTILSVTCTKTVYLRDKIPETCGCKPSVALTIDDDDQGGELTEQNED